MESDRSSTQVCVTCYKTAGCTQQLLQFFILVRVGYCIVLQLWHFCWWFGFLLLSALVWFSV